MLFYDPERESETGDEEEYEKDAMGFTDWVEDEEIDEQEEEEDNDRADDTGRDSYEMYGLDEERDIDDGDEGMMQISSGACRDREEDAS